MTARLTVTHIDAYRTQYHQRPTRNAKADRFLRLRDLTGHFLVTERLTSPSFATFGPDSAEHCSSINRPKRHDIRSYRRIGLTANGRSNQQPVSARFHDALEACVVVSGEESPSTVAALNVWVVADPNYSAGLRSVQRYVRRAYPLPACRVRCRVATPPWIQARASWASFPRVWVGSTRRDLLAFVLTFPVRIREGMRCRIEVPQVSPPSMNTLNR